MRVGVVGLASCYWPNALASSLTKIEDVEIAAAANAGHSDAEIMACLRTTKEDYAERFTLKLYETPEEMIESEGLDAVCICVEHSRQADMVELCAPRGLNIFSAKPMATTRDAADRIVAAVETHGINFTSGTSERFVPGFQKMKELAAAGRIGRLLSLRTYHYHGTIASFGKDDWYLRAEEGGPELSLGWYVVDAMMWLAGEDVTEVYASYENFCSPDTPFMDVGKIFLRFASGAMGSIDIYFSTGCRELPGYEVEILGSEGAIRSEQTGTKIFLHNADAAETFEAEAADPLPRQVADWVAACRTGRPASPTVREAARIMEICFACQESAAARQPVGLS